MSHHHSDSCCSGGKCSCPCHQGQSCCGHDHAHHHEDECGFSKKLIELADEAWMCLLKEKIKAQIASTSGANLDKLAKIVSDANHARWKSKLAGKTEKENFEDQISEFFKSK